MFINSDIPTQNSLSYFGPNLLHSGQTAAHLVNYLVEEDKQILLLNIAKDIDSDHHILRKEEGFTAYFASNGKRKILKENLYNTSYPAVKKSPSRFAGQDA